MKEITAILVDDEFSALKGLQQKIEKLFPEISILATFQKPEEAISFIKNKPPQLLFLDIQMPRINGFELLSALDGLNFQVIFVTAYNEYALAALKKSAIGYVLKPVDNEELKEAIAKAITTIKLKQQLESNNKLIEILTESISNKNKIIVPTAKGLSFIPQDEVLHLEGNEGYTKFHLSDNTELLSSYNLGKFEPSLGRVFFKCHKSHIVNLGKVRSFENEGYLILENSIRVPISKANKKAFLNIFR
jgi:two-component system LytT family response regulator